VRALALGARTDLEINRISLGLIDEMVTVGNASLETRSVTRPQHGRAALLHQRDLAFEHIDELVFGLVPVAQRRSGAGLQSREIDSKLRESDDIAERSLLAALGDRAPWIWIAAFGAHCRLRNLNLRQLALPLRGSIADRLA
jgi:hypothetical protein